MRLIKYSSQYGIRLVIIMTMTLSYTAVMAGHKENSANYSDMKAQMRSMINKSMAEQGIVGLSIALIDDQKIIWSEGFGWADREHAIAATPDTVYQTGSITKVFTATAAMQLAELKCLDLDLPLEVALPGFSMRSRYDSASMVTPRNIMTHHSGLPTDYINGMWNSDVNDFTQLVYLLNNQYLAHEPDTVHMYSNVGFTLLGHAIQNVSEQSYASYIQDYLLSPMGMTSSYVSQALHEDKRSAQGYFEGKRAEPIALRDIPAGGLNSTVVDMAKFMQMIFAGGISNDWIILNNDSLSEMVEYQDGDAVFDVGSSVGLGWYINNVLGDEAGKVIMHNGSTVVHNSSMMALTKHKLGVVVLANTDTAVGVVDQIAEQTLAQALNVKNNSDIKSDDSDNLEYEIELEVEQEQTKITDQSALAGRYASSLGLIEIKEINGKLKAYLPDEELSLDLVKKSDGYYYFEYKLFGLVPIDVEELGNFGISYREVAGRELLLFHQSGITSLGGEKIVSHKLPKIWLDRVGRYVYGEIDKGYTIEAIEITIKDGLIMMQTWARWPGSQQAESSQYILRPVDENHAVIYGLWRNTGDTVGFIKHDGQIELNYSGYSLNLETR